MTDPPIDTPAAKLERSYIVEVGEPIAELTT